jgi:hypothetical protein
MKYPLRFFAHNACQMTLFFCIVDLHKEEPDSQLRPWSDAHYSFGARQTVYRMFAKTEGFVVHTSHTHDTYWRDLSSSIFCLATAGWGWGGRMKTAVTRGCIPVIIQVSY